MRSGMEVKDVWLNMVKVKVDSKVDDVVRIDAIKKYVRMQISNG